MGYPIKYTTPFRPVYNIIICPIKLSLIIPCQCCCIFNKKVTCLSKEEDISSSDFFSLPRLEMDCGVEREGDFALDIKLVISRP